MQPTLDLLHTISGLLILISFAGKVLLHYYLDHKQGKGISLLYSLAAPAPYFMPYKRLDDFRLSHLQRVCNLLLTLAAIALIINIILGIAIYFKE